jgi:hypothetical protein
MVGADVKRHLSVSVAWEGVDDVMRLMLLKPGLKQLQLHFLLCATLLGFIHCNVCPGFLKVNNVFIYKMFIYLNISDVLN